MGCSPEEQKPLSSSRRLTPHSRGQREQLLSVSHASLILDSSPLLCWIFWYAGVKLRDVMTALIITGFKKESKIHVPFPFHE